MFYEIVINETQRKLFAEALKVALENKEFAAKMEAMTEGDFAFDNAKGEIEFLIDAFNGLPTEETGESFECQPGERRRMLHGFCP